MRSRRALLLASAALFAAIDLLHKTLGPAEVHHARTPFIALIMGGLIAALVVLVPRLPSNVAALGAGMACGGAVGNLVSLLSWSGGVPDPFVVASPAQGLAFNLADLFAVVGDALLLSAAVVYGARHRERLREPI